MIPLRWTPRADADIQRIFKHLEREASLTVAISQCACILRSLRQIQQFPSSGTPEPGLECRRLLAKGTPYAIFHRQRHGVIELYAIRHGAQKPLQNPPSR